MAEKVSENTANTWLRPWNIEKFDDLYNRDERYFAILTKGALAWLTQNIILYNKPITHFIFNTGSAYLYVESNGYSYSVKETSGEDYIYMHMPRSVIEISDINIPMEELTSPYVRGQYERRDGNNIKGYNAQIRRLPIEVTLTAHYVLSNFNELMILIQELIDKVTFQKYFNVVYLGQIIQCSLEINPSYQFQINKIDMESPETNQKTIDIVYKLCSNYPLIDEATEVENSKVIAAFGTSTTLFKDDPNNVVGESDKTLDITNMGGIDDTYSPIYIYRSETEELVKGTMKDIK